MPTLFKENGALASPFAAVLQQIRAGVTAVPDRDAVGRDRDEWIDAIVESSRIAPPVAADGGVPEVEDLGRQMRDVTGQAGISFSTTEWGNVQRETVNYRATLRFEGTVELLLCAPAGGAAYTPVERVDGREGTVSQSFYYVVGSESAEQFTNELNAWVSQVAAGAGVVAERVEQFNAALAAEVSKIVDEHIAKADAAAAFTAALPFAVIRREDAPPTLAAPPIQAIRREIPQSGALPADQPALGRYFNEIVAVLGSAVRAMERTPGRYHEWDEESLRDALLVPLNAQFKGAAHGEAFNASGKTDLLIRAGDENLFIGECKIWGGASQLNAAVNQLLGYSTWRDSRLALIVFIKTKDAAQTAERARTVLEERPEFEHWLAGAAGLKARIRWTDDRARTATLALILCHLRP